MQGIFRRKRLSALLTATAALAASLIPYTACTVSADSFDIVVLGDSISARYNLAEGQYGYQDYLADAYDGANLNDLAVSGYTTQNLLTLLEKEDVQKTVADAELICVTIGANDLLQATFTYLNSKMQGNYDSFVDYLTDLAAQGDDKISSVMFGLTGALRPARNTAIENIKQIDTQLHTLNSSAKIVYQTIYNPFERRDLTYNGTDYSDKYEMLTDYLRNQLYQMNSVFGTLEDSLTADIYTTFRDNGWNYIFSDRNDVHPNTLGHAVIASVILDTLGLKNKVVPQFAAVLAEKKTTDHFYIPSAVREALIRHAGIQISHEYGDVNRDGTVDPDDAILILKYVTLVTQLGMDPDDPDFPLAFDAEQRTLADINGDGSSETEDVIYSLKYYTLKYQLGDDTVTYDTLCTA